MPKTRVPKNEKPLLESPPTQSWSDQVDDELHDNILDSQFPSISELKTEADEIQQTLESSDVITETKLQSAEEELQTLMNPEKTPVQSQFFSAFPSGPSKPAVSTKGSKTEAEDVRTETDYQESFTSQEETAQIRHHIDSIDTRLQTMETMFEAMLAERKNLPKHLELYREEMNKQLTVMADRLHTALEKNIDVTAVAQSSKDVEILTAETNHVLGQLHTDTVAEPSTDSATARSAPITKTRRRVRVIE